MTIKRNWIRHKLVRPASLRMAKTQVTVGFGPHYALIVIFTLAHCNTLLLLSRFSRVSVCPTLCDPIDGSPPGSSVPGILQARTLEWVAISLHMLNDPPTGALDSSQVNHRSPKGEWAPNPANPRPFPQIVRLFLPLVSLWNYPAHEN